MASRTKDLGLAVLVAALVATGGFMSLGYYQRHKAIDRAQVASAAHAPAPAQTTADPQAPAAVAEAEAAPPAAPPGTEVVPAEEAETDRGQNAASPEGPTLSFGRAFGLHRTPDPLRLSASAAIVVNQTTGQPVLQKNAQAVLPMASLTKLMTSLLVAEARLPMDEVLTITEDDVDNERHSRSRLRVGTRLTREEALHLALMSSENRAAHALGRTYPGGLQAMVQRMNTRAQQLGMKNTRYVDPTGLSNGNRSTAEDLARLVAEVAKHPQLREFSTTPAHLADLGGRNLQYLNSNRLVRNQRSGWDIELQKTGYIVEAGRCLTMLAKVAGHDLVMVILDSDSNGTRIADAQKMRRWVVAQNGWQDNLAVAKAEPRPARKAAPGKKAVASKKADAKDKAVVARAKAGKKGEARTAAARDKSDAKATAARKKGGKEPAVARKDGGKAPAVAGQGRVKQTYAARKDDDKS